MPGPIEQALVSLVPTLNTLPQELLDLSSSLLAQSRSKAATLKPEEEIGRTYACAHIAVDRLKQRLDVDKIVAKPPVPPRVYKKLYGYLDAALTVSTPRAQRVKDVVTPGSRGRRSAVGTPSKTVGSTATTPNKLAKNAVSTPAKTPASTTKSVGSAAKDVTTSARRTRSAAKDPVLSEQESVQNDDNQGLPVQIPPMITAVCGALEAPEAISHVTSAVSSVLALRGWQEDGSKKRKASSQTSASKRQRTSASAAASSLAQESPEAITQDTIPALLVALSLATTFTLRNTIIDGTAYATARSSASNALDPSPTDAEVDDFLHASKSEGWLELSWFAEVRAAATAPPPAQTPKKNKQPAKTPLRRKEKHAPRPKDLNPDLMDIDEEPEEERLGAGLMWGLGTMFQDAVDWLSTERRREYKLWEADVQTRCDEIDLERQMISA